MNRPRHVAHDRTTGRRPFPRLRARSRDQRGVTVVEAAFITPVFFVLVLGMIEIGLAMNDYLSLANASRAGARVASASGNDVYADYGILRAVEREAAALNEDQIDIIVVYKPTNFGEAPTATCQAGNAVSGVCNVYRPADFARPEADFGCRSDRSLDRYWCPSSRDVSLSGNGSDYVGVWMKIEHDWVTKMFGNSKTLTDSSVIRLEPRTK